MAGGGGAPVPRRPPHGAGPGGAGGRDARERRCGQWGPFSTWGCSPRASSALLVFFNNLAGALRPMGHCVVVGAGGICISRVYRSSMHIGDR
jgi:hypothetical protein